jgi:hypothetical protein
MSGIDGWSKGPICPQQGQKFELLMTDGTRRDAEHRPERDYTSLWFTDCTHPLQNALVWEGAVDSWRAKP